MDNFGLKIEAFKQIFFEQNGYQKVIEGLQNTLIIAIAGLLIGIIIGILIATVRVVPKYKILPRILNGFCSFYVGLFRGTPMVVQLLVCYYVLLPIIGVKLTGVQVSVLVFGLNSGAYISEMMRAGILSVDGGQMEAGRAMGLSFATTMRKIVIPQAVKNILKRNVVGAVNAVSCANMALAGVDYAIPCDEVIDAMGRVGSLLSPALRETGQGGLAATPTGVRIAQTLAEQG